MPGPAGGIRVDGRQPYVLHVVGGVVKRSDVKIGMDNGIRAEIESGLSGDEQIIIGNVSGLAVGDAVTVKGS